MTEQETEYYRLICDFMEYSHDYRQDLRDCKGALIWPFYSIKNLYPQFDKDWNYLIPVVEKIEKVVPGTSIIIENSICKITTNKQIYADKRYYLNTEVSETKIEAVYNAVIAFINWYNTNKP